MRLSRRVFTAGLASLPLAARAANAGPIRLGLQKAGSLVVLRRRGGLEALGRPVQWVEFNSGPAILEAINAGAVDFAGCGDTPPIFAQAAGVPMLYVGAQPNDGANIGIVVRDDGPIRTIADLRGRRIALTKGSTVQNLLVRALASAGLTLRDVQVAYLPVADGASAFHAGAVDAFAAWDPYFGIAQQQPGVRVLTTGQGVAPTNFFFVAATRFAREEPGAVVTLLAAINAAAAWAADHPDAVVEEMSAVTGVPPATQRLVAARTLFAVQPMDARIVAEQQAIADSFRAERIIPAPIDVAAAVWSPPRAGP